MEEERSGAGFRLEQERSDGGLRGEDRKSGAGLGSIFFVVLRILGQSLTMFKRRRAEERRSPLLHFFLASLSSTYAKMPCKAHYCTYFYLLLQVLKLAT